LRPILDDQALDEVEAVQLGVPGGDPRQIPPRRRRPTTRALAAVQGAAPLQDQADGAQRGWLANAAGPQRAVDGRGPEPSEVTGGAEVLTDGQHKILQRTVGTVDRGGQAAGAVGPVHAVEALARGACDPALHGGQGHSKLVGNAAHGEAPADGSNHLASLVGGTVFCSWQVPREKVSCHGNRAALTSECLRVTDLPVVALTRSGVGNRKAGNAWLKWAFSEAAVLSAQKDERIGGLLQRLASKLGKAKALSALAHKLGRAFYHMLHTKEVFDVNRFVRH